MSDEIKNVNLSFQCSENWNDMKVTDGKRICDKCQHRVLDFREMSSAEFQDHLKNATHPVCGRFKRLQMSSDFMKYAAATIIAASSLGAASCATEEPISAPVIEQIIPELPPVEIEEFVTMGIVFEPMDTVGNDSTRFD